MSIMDSSHFGGIDFHHDPASELNKCLQSGGIGAAGNDWFLSGSMSRVLESMYVCFEAKSSRILDASLLIGTQPRGRPANHVSSPRANARCKCSLKSWFMAKNQGKLSNCTENKKYWKASASCLD